LGEGTSGRGRGYGESKGGSIWSMYFIYINTYMYKDRTLKPVKIILSRGEGMRENDGGDEPNQATLYLYMSK
jgi:hypothetical protein